MALKKLNKLYYSIGEVSQITNLKQYVLRYWETEFSQLSPKKNKAGNRKYREKDIDIVKQIKTLLYEKKYTIIGAKQFLSTNEQNKTSDINPSSDLLNEFNASRQYS